VTSTINAALTGNPRTITVTNIGSADAVDVNLALASSLPLGTTLSPASCGLIHAGDTCVITVAPGSSPSEPPGSPSLPAFLSIAGVNTNTVDTAIQVLDYGSVYQGGYVFAIDDTTATSTSTGGKILAPQDEPSRVWSSIFSSTGASSLTDGAANTAAIYGVQPNSAAGACAISVGGGYADWYLPAICELGYSDSFGCGSQAAPLIQNVASNLLENGRATFTNSSFYWSSTEDAINPVINAFGAYFGDPGAYLSLVFAKPNALPLRCVRALTN
jgi:hypothetical protein